MKVIGLTGGIATGKTTITDYLLSLGAAVIDADSISRRLTEPGNAALLEIEAAFGKEYLDEQGSLKRKELGRLIFSDEASRLKLNQILHPKIAGGIKEELARYQRAGHAAVVLSAPLLFEAGLDALTDEVWLVALAQPEQIRRLMARDGISEEEAKKRLNAQSSLQDKLAKAHRIIDNNGSSAKARETARKFWEEISGQ